MGDDRLILDVGLPLASAAGSPRPEIAGLWAGETATVRAVLITHGHPDHYGLISEVDEAIPVYMGAAAASILKAARFFMPDMAAVSPAGELRDGEPIPIGAFRVTPWLVDHSAFDAYALMVEAGGRRLLYTGDLRAHGRKARSVHRLASEAADVDVVVTEGTRITRDADERSDLSEHDVEARCLDLFREARGLALAFYSPQNVDRLVSLYRAAKRSGRTFVMDVYTATVAAATGRATIPQASWDGVRVYLPQSQRRKIIESGEFDRVAAIRSRRVYPEELSEHPSRFVLSARGGMVGELARAGCLEGAVAVWSMWPGYLQRESGCRTAKLLAEAAVPMEVVHSSGHVSAPDLSSFLARLAPQRVVPIHSAAPERLSDLTDRVELHADGEWWDV